MLKDIDDVVGKEHQEVIRRMEELAKGRDVEVERKRQETVLPANPLHRYLPTWGELWREIKGWSPF